MKNNKYSGSNFDDFLKEEGIFDEVKALAQKELSVETSLEADRNSEDLKDSTKPITRFFRWLQHILGFKTSF